MDNLTKSQKITNRIYEAGRYLDLLFQFSLADCTAFIDLPRKRVHRLNLVRISSNQCHFGDLQKMSSPQYNTRNAGVKRLMKEAMELKDPTDLYAAQPFADNLFEWHFTVKGPADSDFEGGIYHGRIIFPSDYPMKPPNLMILTPNGRFELNKKICLSISGYHPETWLPSWSVRTALLALIGFMPSEPGGAIGGLDYPPEERKRLAKLSVSWTCKECGLCMKNALKSGNSAGDEPTSLEMSSNMGENKPDKSTNQTETIPSGNSEHVIGIQRQIPVESNGLSLFSCVVLSVNSPIEK